MKKLLLSTLALALGVSANAQTYFSQTVGQSVPASFGANTGFGSVKLSSGNFLTVEVNSFAGFTIRQYNSGGGLVLTTQLSNSVCNIASINSVTDMGANALLVTGMGNTTMGSAYYVAKINLLTNAITLTTKTASFGYTKGPKAVTNGYSVYVNFPEFSAFTLDKFDNNLNPIWSKTCESDTTSGKNPGTDCELLDDSTIIVVGKCDDDLGWGECDSTEIDSFRRWNAPGYTRVYGISRMADGSALVSGLNADVYASSISSPLLIKMSSNGNVIWSKLLDEANPAVTFSRFVDAIELPNGNIVAFATYTEAYSDTYADGVCMFDANGNLLFAKKLGSTTNPYYMYDFKVYNDGILMSGVKLDAANSTESKFMIFTDFNLNQLCSSTDVTLIATDFSMGSSVNTGKEGIREGVGTLANTINFGTMTMGSSVGVEVCATSTGINEENGIESSVYPNPVNAGNNVNIVLSQAGAYDVMVIDFNGKVVSQSRVNGNTALVTTSGFASGNYLVRVTSNGTAVATEKLLVK